MPEPKVTRGKAKAALQALSRGKRDAAKASPSDFFPWGIIANEPRNRAYDRDTVLSATAALEQTIEEAILTKFALRQDADKMLFLDPSLPIIRDFYAKCQIAYLVGLIGKLTLNDLSVIRHVRNGFAHTRGYLDLEMPEFENMLEHLTFPDRWPGLMKHQANQDLRERFIQTCFQFCLYFAVGHLNAEKDRRTFTAKRAAAILR